MLPQKSMKELTTLYDNGQYKDFAEKFHVNVMSFDDIIEELENNKRIKTIINKNNLNNNNSTNGTILKKMTIHIKMKTILFTILNLTILNLTILLTIIIIIKKR